MNSLGQRIRFFRTRRGLSQLDVELGVGISPNSLTYIENDKKTPKLETLNKIATHLHLNFVDFAYLTGRTVDLPSEEEKQGALEEAADQLHHEYRLATLIDERKFILALSDQQVLFLKKSGFPYDVVGRNGMEVISQPNSFMRAMYSPESWHAIVSHTLMRTFGTRPYLRQDTIFLQQMESIANEFAHFRSAWEEACEQFDSSTDRETLLLHEYEDEFVRVKKYILRDYPRFHLRYIDEENEKRIFRVYPLVVRYAQYKRQKKNRQAEAELKKMQSMVNTTKT